MTNNTRTYECSTKFSSYVTTSKVFQLSLRSRGYSPSGRDGKFCWGKFVTKSSLKTKIEYLYTGIINTVFQRFTTFILHTSNRVLISLRKTDVSHIFHCFFYPGYVLDFMMYHICYTIQFFSQK